MGFFYAVELVKDADNTSFDADEREHLLRGYMGPAMLRAGLIARADDRGDSILQIAPPLIADDDVLDEIVDKMRTVLVGAQQELMLV